MKLGRAVYLRKAKGICREIQGMVENQWQWKFLIFISLTKKPGKNRVQSRL
jgi:hypothetical protein